jgi:VCBS repeat-containing protein
LHRIKLDWKAPTVGTVVSFTAYRVEEGSSVAVQVGTVDGGTRTFVDPTELPNGVQFTYFVVAFIDDDGNSATAPLQSGPSNSDTITAVNTPPVAKNDPDNGTYSTNQDTPLNVVTPGVLGNGVLANDTDVDSASLTAVRDVLDVGPSHGTLALNANGSFTYTPNAGFAGTDSFTYKAKDVTPISIANVAATVTITVLDITPPVVTLTIPAPNGLGGFFKTKPVTVGVSATDPSNVISFGCTDNGLPISVGNPSGIGTPAATGTLSVSGEGTHSLICTATDSLGNSGAASGSSNTGTVKIDTVAPDITITAPANATYLLNASVPSSYSCLDPIPGSGLDTCVGPVSSGSNFNTSTVGPKTFTVTATDVAGNQTIQTNNYSVNYAITLTPLKISAQQGSAVPVIWQLKDGPGNIISSLSTLIKMESVFNGAVPPGGCVSSAIGTKETLYSLPNGATGKSSFRFVASSQSFQFNWDTTTTTTVPIQTAKGCYTVLIYLDDQSAAKMTTAVQLK